MCLQSASTCRNIFLTRAPRIHARVLPYCRVFEARQEERAREEAVVRASAVGTGDRSERIRTYNFPQASFSSKSRVAKSVAGDGHAMGGKPRACRGNLLKLGAVGGGFTTGSRRVFPSKYSMMYFLLFVPGGLRGVISNNSTSEVSGKRYRKITSPAILRQRVAGATAHPNTHTDELKVRNTRLRLPHRPLFTVSSLVSPQLLRGPKI